MIKFPKLNKKTIGFTLIELLVVIAIIGLLVSIRNAREKARIANLLQFSAQIKHALGAYAKGIWTFDDGTANDNSGYGNNGTLSGAVITDDGIEKKAVTLDDTFNANISVNPDDSLDIAEKITIEAWIKTNKIGPGKIWTVLGKMDMSYYFVYMNEQIIFTLIDSSSDAHSFACALASEDLLIGKWNHLAATYDGSKMRIYVNAEQPCPNGFDYNGDIKAENSYLSIGTVLDGIIDEVRLYSEALNLSQIRKLYAQGLIKKELLVER